MACAVFYVLFILFYTYTMFYLYCRVCMGGHQFSASRIGHLRNLYRNLLCMRADFSAGFFLL